MTRASKPCRAPRPEKPIHEPAGWTTVRVRVLKRYRPVTVAIAAVMTEFHEAPAGEPWTEAQVLQAALAEGLIGLEKRYLGTDSVDECEPEEPATEHQLALARALVKALERRS